MPYDINFANDNFTLQVAEATMYKDTFLLWPTRWKKHKHITPLTWQVFPFHEDSIDHIPEEPGVYAFCVEPQIFSDLKPCYLLYVGETTRTLKTRFKEYLYEASGSDKGRKKIYMALNLYADYVYFYCSPVDSSISPEDVEKELLNAFIPPKNDKLPVEVSKIVQVLRS